MASAARAVHAAGCGVTLSLIGAPIGERDPQLSHRVREAVLTAVTTGAPDAPNRPTEVQARAVHAVALRATLAEGDSAPLTEAETTLLVEWLDRLMRAADEPGGSRQ